MRDEKKAARCTVCRAGISVAGKRGRPSLYCSRSCQARAYRQRKRPPVPAPERPAPASDARSRRRRQIAGAVWRIAAERGLEAASMREIAIEAGVSLRVVQYHFGSKHELLVAALHLLHRENERLARTRVHFDPENLRGVLSAMLDEFLPLDAQRAMALRVFSAYYARSLTDPAIAAVFLSDDHPLEELVAGFIATAQVGGQTAPGLDAQREADLLVAAAVGLGGDVLHERRTLDDVRRTLDYHLAKIFTPRAQAEGSLS
ncbi:TetR/AcrR family transcriptional regulator [Streptomyces sp. NPDC048441]|uniref:TetR/AcrR family transcriptional regulator n=1 Tax=Streptomyces sp. NPDC048441 TaxID=3365552 RepID=UPI00371CDA3E